MCIGTEDSTSDSFNESHKTLPPSSTVSGVTTACCTCCTRTLGTSPECAAAVLSVLEAVRGATCHVPCPRVHVSRCRVSVELLTVYTTPRPSHNCQPVLHGPWLPWAQCRHQPTLHTALRLQQLKSRQICKHHDVRPFRDLPPKMKPKVRIYIYAHIYTGPLTQLIYLWVRT